MMALLERMEGWQEEFVNALGDAGKWLFTSATNGRAEVVRWLLDHGVNPDGGSKRSPIAVAASMGHLQIVGILADHGADLNGTWRGETAPTWASRRRYTRMVRFLINRGADLHLKDEYGRSALDHALMQWQKDIAQLLQQAISKQAAQASCKSTE